MHGEHDNIQVFCELKNTNLLLGKLINEIGQTERRVQALEERASTSVSSSSSGGSGSTRQKQKNIPLQVTVCIVACECCL